MVLVLHCMKFYTFLLTPESNSKKIALWLYLCVFISFSPVLQAQDAHFSQFYATPLSVNPAFSGTSLQGRFSFGYRAQWPKLPGEFVTYQIGYDQFIPEYKSSFGVWANLDQAGSSGMQSISFNAIYAYHLPLQDDWALSSGFQLGYGNRKLDYFKLVFGDQLSATGATSSFSNEQGIENMNIHYVDVGVGFLLYSENFWLGASGQHLNQPNHSITGIPEVLPMKISVHTGFKAVYYRQGRSRREGYSASLSPILFYSQQGSYKQLDVGVNGFLDPLIAGIWYRGVPIQKSYNGAVVLSTGFKYKDFRFLYSYDIPVGRFATITGGAHEFSLLINAGDLRSAQKYRKRSHVPVFPALID